MPTPSSSRSSKNKKPESSNMLFYGGIGVVLLIAAAFLWWSFEHRETQVPTQEQEQVAESTPSSPPISLAPPQVERTGVVPSAQDLLNAMTPDAQAHEFSLSSVQVVQCTPVINAFTATQVGEARCQVQIEIAKKGGKPKQLLMPIHVLQNADKTWKVIQ